MYTVREDEGQVTVCVVIGEQVIVDIEFTVDLSTVESSAGKHCVKSEDLAVL